MTITTTQRIAAVGATPWIPVNTRQPNFQLGLGVVPSSNATCTFTVQHAFDEPLIQHPVSISQTGTTATVTDSYSLNGVAGHGLSVGDTVNIQGSGSALLDGLQTVASVTSQTVYTFTNANSGTLASGLQCTAASQRAFNHAVIVAQSARIDGNYAFDVRYVRLNVTAISAGYVDFQVVQGAI